MPIAMTSVGSVRPRAFRTFRSGDPRGRSSTHDCGARAETLAVVSRVACPSGPANRQVGLPGRQGLQSEAQPAPTVAGPQGSGAPLGAVSASTRRNLAPPDTVIPSNAGTLQGIGGGPGTEVPSSSASVPPFHPVAQVVRRALGGAPPVRSEFQRSALSSRFGAACLANHE